MTYRSNSTDRFDWLGNSFDPSSPLLLSNPSATPFKQFNENQSGCLKNAMRFDYEFDMHPKQIRDRRRRNMLSLSARDNSLSLSLSRQNFKCTKPLKQNNQKSPLKNNIMTVKSEYYTDEVVQKSVASQALTRDRKKESNLFSWLDNTSYERKMEVCPVPAKSIRLQEKKMFASQY